jgi:hypothetical protein
MITLVVMCAISMCVAKSQRTKGAQKYAPDGDVPGKHSRNFVRNVHVKQHLKEIDFGSSEKKKVPKDFFMESKPNYETSKPKRKSYHSQHNGYHVEVRSERKKSRSHRKNHRSSPPIPSSHGRKPLRQPYPVNI